MPDSVRGPVAATTPPGGIRPQPASGHGRRGRVGGVAGWGLAALFSAIALEFLAPAGPFEFLLLGWIALLVVRGFIRLFAEAFPLRPRAGSGLNPRRVTLAVWAVLLTGVLATLIAGATLTALAPTEPAGGWLAILAGVLIVSGMIWMVARRRTLDLGDGEWSVDLDGDGDSGNGGGV